MASLEESFWGLIQYMGGPIVNDIQGHPETSMVLFFSGGGEGGGGAFLWASWGFLASGFTVSSFARGSRVRSRDLSAF